MKAKEGDVIRFYFSESTQFTKERTNDNTEMVDIVIKEDGELIAISSFGDGCYLYRLENQYSVVGNVKDEKPIQALKANGWKDELIQYVIDEHLKTKER